MTMLGRSVAVALALAALAALASAELSPREEEFAAVPSGAAARESLLYITSEAHVAGTTGDAKMAEYVQSEFRFTEGMDTGELFEQCTSQIKGDALRSVYMYMYEGLLSQKLSFLLCSEQVKAKLHVHGRTCTAETELPSLLGAGEG